MTRTDVVKQTLVAAVEAYRPLLDGPAPLASVSVLVKLDRRTGRPREIILRTEDVHALKTC